MAVYLDDQASHQLALINILSHGAADESVSFLFGDSVQTQFTAIRPSLL